MESKEAENNDVYTQLKDSANPPPAPTDKSKEAEGGYIDGIYHVYTTQLKDSSLPANPPPPPTIDQSNVPNASNKYRSLYKKSSSIPQYDNDDIVLVFPYKEGDEAKHPERYTCETFIHLMLGMRKRGGIIHHTNSTSKDDIVQDPLRLVFRTPRCFLNDVGLPMDFPQRNPGQAPTQLSTEDCQHILQQEYKHYIGHVDPIPQKRFCELIVAAITRRLQVACGLSTRVFRSFDDKNIFIAVRADDIDLRSEANRINYHLQVSNKPFHARHAELNKMLREDLMGEDAFAESIAHLLAVRGTAEENVLTDSRESIFCMRHTEIGHRDVGLRSSPQCPEMDPNLFSNGSEFHPHLSASLHQWGHSERADLVHDHVSTRSSTPLIEEETRSSGEPNNDSSLRWWQKWSNFFLYIPWNAHTYFSPYVPYDQELKFQPYYRWYPINFKSTTQETLFQQIDRIRLVTSIIERHVGVDALVNGKHLEAIFPLHDHDHLVFLKRHWAFNFGLWTQPIMDIRAYFGEKVALYFSYVEFYSKMLIFPSVFGMFIYIFSLAYSSKNEDEGFYLIVFAVSVVIWSAVFTEFWRRKNAMYNTLWGISIHDTVERPRVQFIGEQRYNAVTDEKELWYTDIRKRRRTIVISLLVVLLMICIVIVALGALFWLKFYITKPDGPQIAYGSQIISVANAIQIIILNSIYRGVALKLNDWENHRTDIAYENYLVFKVFLFQFVNSFASFIYIAFFKKTVEGQCVDDDCLAELGSQLAILFIVRMVMGNIGEILIPWLMFKYRIWRGYGTLSTDTAHSGDRNTDAVEHQFKLNPYEQMEAFEDYNELVIQYGFVILFVVAFPLIPLLALVNNVLEVHVDSVKLCVGHRRPYPSKAANIGSWLLFLEWMSNFAIVTNCALILFTSDLFETLSSTNRWIVFIATEHLCLMIKFGVQAMIPEMPTELRLLNQRFERTKAQVYLGLHIEKEEVLHEIAEEVNVHIEPNPKWNRLT